MTNFSLHQLVSFPLDYFCSYVNLRDVPASRKNMCFRPPPPGRLNLSRGGGNW